MSSSWRICYPYNLLWLHSNTTQTFSNIPPWRMTSTLGSILSSGTITWLFTSIMWRNICSHALIIMIISSGNFGTYIWEVDQKQKILLEWPYMPYSMKLVLSVKAVECHHYRHQLSGNSLGLEFLVCNTLQNLFPRCSHRTLLLLASTLWWFARLNGDSPGSAFIICHTVWI